MSLNFFFDYIFRSPKTESADAQDELPSPESLPSPPTHVMGSLPTTPEPPPVSDMQFLDPAEMDTSSLSIRYKNKVSSFPRVLINGSRIIIYSVESDGRTPRLIFESNNYLGRWQGRNNDGDVYLVMLSDTEYAMIYKSNVSRVFIPEGEKIIKATLTNESLKAETDTHTYIFTFSVRIPKKMSEK